MISAQNTRLPTAPPSVIPLKPTCGPDDGSTAGPWLLRPAAEIDGHDKRVLRASGRVTAERP